MIRNPWLCVIIVSALGVTILTGAIGSVLLAALGREAPALLQLLAGTALGSLASFLVNVPLGSFLGGQGPGEVGTHPAHQYPAPPGLPAPKPLAGDPPPGGLMR